MQRGFNGAENWLNGHPGQLAGLLEGALHMIRRSFFNQAPQVTPSPQTTSQDGSTIRGRIGAFSLTGDELSYTVTADPHFGTVEVDAEGTYTYTPSPGYDGSDSFTVNITPQRRSINILDPNSDGSREVTINIGKDTYYDNPDFGVYLSDTAGQLTVKKGVFNQFTGTVSLTNLAPDTLARWMDTSGRHGAINVEQLTREYGAFKARAAENGATVSLALRYSAADGSQNVVLMRNAKLAVDALGQYVLTGHLAADPEIDQEGVDIWDVVGKADKPLYEGFRTTYNIEAGQRWKFSTVETKFSGAQLYVNTITPLSYEQCGLYGSDSESLQPANALLSADALPSANSLPAQAATPSTGGAVQVDPTASRMPVTAMITVGNTVVVGRNDGSIQVWNQGQESQLQAGGSYAVSNLLPYNRPLKDGQGNTVAGTFTGYISGTTLTVTGLGVGSTVAVGSEITGAGVAPGTTITKFNEQCADSACTTTVVGSGKGGSNGYTGTYEVSISQKIGSPVASPSPVVTTDATGAVVSDPSLRIPAGITFTQKGVPAVEPGFIATLSDGSVKMYSAATGWVDLGVNGVGTAIINYGEGFVAAGSYSVKKWNGPGTNPDTSTWKYNWTTLLDYDSPDWPGGATEVTALMHYNGRPDVCGAAGCDGFLVGFGGSYRDNGGTWITPGSVMQYNEAKDGAGKPGWWTLGSGFGSGVKAIVESQTDASGLPTFAVGLDNGTVKQWQWNGSTFKWVDVATGLGGEAETPDNGGHINSNITSMVSYGKGFVVGLKTGEVYQSAPYDITDDSKNSILKLGDSLKTGESLKSPNGAYTLTMQSDGNLVLAKGGRPVWSAMTQGTYAGIKEDAGQALVAAQGYSNITATMQSNGSFIVKGSSGGAEKALWSTYTAGTGADRVVLQDDGNLVVYDASVKAQWASGTKDQNASYNREAGQLTTKLQDDGWDSAVSLIVPFESATVGKGVIVGLDDGSVQAWKGPGKGWVLLANPSNPMFLTNKVVAIAPVTQTVVDMKSGNPVKQDGVFAALENGDLDQWSGLISGDTAQQTDWTHLTGPGTNFAASALARKEEFQCSDLQCSNPGALKDAVTFGKQIAKGGAQTWGLTNGIGSSADPLFGNTNLQASPTNATGVYYALAWYKPISPAALNYVYPNPVNFIGSIDEQAGANCSRFGQTSCSLLTVTAAANPGVDIAKLPLSVGGLVESGTLLGVGADRVQPQTRIIGVGASDATSRVFQLSGLPQTVQQSQLTVLEAPGLKVGADINPLVYGYVYVPDSWNARMSASNYSFGALLAAELGASLGINTGTGGSVAGLEKDIPLLEVSKLLPYGTVQVNSGIKVGANLTLNGVSDNATGATSSNANPKTFLNAYAYLVPGMLLTYNTAGAPGELQFGTNSYIDFSANDFKDITGATATLTMAPYINLLYGLTVPDGVPLVGGWSFIDVGAGVSAPVTATLCLDSKNQCPTGGTGSGVASFYGVINDGTFVSSASDVRGDRASANPGNILTVTQPALYSPNQVALNQLVTGPGVKPGTTIVKKLGDVTQGTQYEVSVSQKATGDGYEGTNPKLSSYLTGSTASLALGTEGLLTFHAGVLEAFTTKFTLDQKVPLWNLNTVIGF